MRGSAVSIALVRDGVPVLGVVYSPLAPDDHGDLIAWEEGMPSPRRHDVRDLLLVLVETRTPTQPSQGRFWAPFTDVKPFHFGGARRS